MPTFTYAMNWRNLFQPMTAEETTEAVDRFWVFVKGAIPLPRHGVIVCPQCRDFGTTQYSRVNFSKRNGRSTLPWRAEVSFKCRQCSMWWVQAIPISVDVVNAACELSGARPGTPHSWHWRDILELIEK